MIEGGYYLGGRAEVDAHSPPVLQGEFAADTDDVLRSAHGEHTIHFFEVGEGALVRFLRQGGASLDANRGT